MTSLWNVLAVLCLIGTVAFSVLEVRALLALIRRKHGGEDGRPELGRLVAWSSLVAASLVGFVLFGSLGTLLDGFL